jgi:retinol dehydrogenase 14
MPQTSLTKQSIKYPKAIRSFKIIANQEEIIRKETVMSDLEGKVALVTGATSGIGKAAALELAKMGAHVIVVGRNLAKTEASVQEIKTQSANQLVDMLLADLSSMKAVRQLAQEFKEQYQQLDILVNNAGAIVTSRQESVDGYEMTFAVNHLAHFLLTNLLLDVLQSSNAARVINVSSDAHPMATLDFDDLQNKNTYQFLKVYAKSKLANILFTYELARRLEGSNVSVNAMEPGAVATNLLGYNSGPFWNLLARFISPFLSPFLSTPKKGAETIIYLASSAAVKDISGQYFDKNCQSVKSSPVSYDEQVASRLWDESTRLVGLADV